MEMCRQMDGYAGEWDGMQIDIGMYSFIVDTMELVDMVHAV